MRNPVSTRRVLRGCALRPCVRKTAICEDVFDGWSRRPTIGGIRVYGAREPEVGGCARRPYIVLRRSTLAHSFYRQATSTFQQLTSSDFERSHRLRRRVRLAICSGTAVDPGSIQQPRGATTYANDTTRWCERHVGVDRHPSGLVRRTKTRHRPGQYIFDCREWHDVVDREPCDRRHPKRSTYVSVRHVRRRVLLGRHVTAA